MNIKKFIEAAKALEQDRRERTTQPFFTKTIAWFSYLGLLRHNQIEKVRHKVTLGEVLEAGALEPRILEILPAILYKIPDAISFEKKDIPADLAEILKGIQKKVPRKAFRGIPVDRYLAWMKSPVLDIALKRLYFRGLPRTRECESNFAKTLSSLRHERALTQAQLASDFNLSLRVIRDLEQGRETASLENVIKIFSALGRRIEIR